MTKKVKTMKNDFKKHALDKFPNTCQKQIELMLAKNEDQKHQQNIGYQPTSVFCNLFQ